MARPLWGSLPSTFASISTPLITTRGLVPSPSSDDDVSTVPWSSIKKPEPALMIPPSLHRTCTTAAFALSKSAFVSSVLS
jgi:hypothetical protein